MGSRDHFELGERGHSDDLAFRDKASPNAERIGRSTLVLKRMAC